MWQTLNKLLGKDTLWSMKQTLLEIEMKISFELNEVMYVHQLFINVSVQITQWLSGESYFI